jgi:formylglycine-generating enzyme required for sulfatase activity
MPRITPALTTVALTLALAVPTRAGTLKCPPDSTRVGTVCIDLYEASVWQIAPSKTSLLKKVQKGTVMLADLTAGGATQLGCADAPWFLTAYPANFPNDGNWTAVPGSKPPSPGVYAVSIPGILPSTCLTWFQANQVCGLSGKRLPRNGEWQRAAAGTPDPGTDDGTSDCNISAVGGPVNTGSRSNCKSSWGVFDMVGNVHEWVEDWADRANVNCTDWTSQTGVAGGDISCFGGDGGNGSFNQIPGALIRGGRWDYGASAGVFSVDAGFVPSDSLHSAGFGVRCAR